MGFCVQKVTCGGIDAVKARYTCDRRLMTAEAIRIQFWKDVATKCVREMDTESDPKRHMALFKAQRDIWSGLKALEDGTEPERVRSAKQSWKVGALVSPLIWSVLREIEADRSYLGVVKAVRHPRAKEIHRLYSDLSDVIRNIRATCNWKKEGINE